MQTFYAEQMSNGLFTNIYETPFQVEMCGAEEVHKVIFRERNPEVDLESPYWGWMDAKEDGRFCMIWPSEVQFKMCFPYGVEVKEERGAGRRANLVAIFKYTKEE